jgi:hypothetical protein
VKSATVGRDEDAGGNNSQTLLERLCPAYGLFDVANAGDNRNERSEMNRAKDKTEKKVTALPAGCDLSRDA